MLIPSVDLGAHGQHAGTQRAYGFVDAVPPLLPLQSSKAHCRLTAMQKACLQMRSDAGGLHFNLLCHRGK
jgi:hypothetical protein